MQGAGIASGTEWPFLIKKNTWFGSHSTKCTPFSISVICGSPLSSPQAEEEKKEQDGESSDSAQQRDEEKESDSESKSGNANEQDKEGEDKNSDKESILNEETAAPEEDRRDVKMTKDTGKVSRPEASQKARALKNMRLDKEDVEKYLKQMEKQESELQQRFRINNIEEKDPAYMDPEELREWLKVRNKKKEQQQLNKQDW